MNPRDLAGEVGEHLERLLHEIYELKGESTESYAVEIRPSFIFRHARYVSEIGRDMALLYSRQQYAAAGICVRTMMESAFCVAAAVKKESFAAEKVVAESKAIVKRLRSHFENTEPITSSIAAYEMIGKRTMTACNVTGKPEWNIYDVAVAGGLKNYYTTYMLHCNAVHASLSGMVSHESAITVGTVLETAIACMIITIGHMVQVLPTRDSEAHSGRCIAYLETLAKMKDDGVFDQMNEGIECE